MASTNKTTHYELSQYVGSDKPTYLTDYNGDMSAIDAGIYAAQSKADSAYTLAGTADGKADTAITNAGTAQTDASSALTKIGTMANLNTTEKNSLVGAINEVDGDINKLNLSHFDTYTSTITTTNGTISGADVTVATNTDGSIGKIYGAIYLTSLTAGSYTITIPNTRIRPTENITISYAGFRQVDTTAFGAVSYSVDTVGNVTITMNVVATFQNIWLTPCLIFFKNFGDTPVI